MDFTTASTLLARHAERAFGSATEARARLAAALGERGNHLDSLMEAVLFAEAEVKPWDGLLWRIERIGLRAALAKARAEATEALFEYGISMSTSLVTNAQRLAEQEGLRRFLRATDLEIDADQVPAEAAPESAPAPTPAPVEIPKATPAQKRTLAAIRDNGITLREFRVGRTTVSARQGDCPRKDMVEWAISQGWAQADTSRSLLQGQPVALTEVGTAILGD